MADLSGYRNAAAAIFGGGGIQQRARTFEEQRLIDARAARARMDATITAAAVARQEQDGTLAHAATLPESERNAFLSGRGAEIAALSRARLTDDTASRRLRAEEMLAQGNFMGGNAAIAAGGTTPLRIFDNDGGLGFNPYLPGGGEVTVLPTGAAAIGAAQARAMASGASADRAAAGAALAREQFQFVAPKARAAISAAEQTALSQQQARELAGQRLVLDQYKAAVEFPKLLPFAPTPAQAISELPSRMEAPLFVAPPAPQPIGQAAQLPPAVTRDGAGAPVLPVPGAKKADAPPPAPHHVAILRADPSPDAMAEFDEVYGPGAAAMQLGR